MTTVPIGDALALLQAHVPAWRDAADLLIRLARVGDLTLTAKRLRYIDEVQVQDAEYLDASLGDEELERAESWTEADWRAGLVDGPLLLRPGMSFVASGVVADSQQFDMFLAGLRPASVGPSVPDVRITAKGRQPGPGRRPKEFWEPCVVAIAAQLYNGDLRPKCQSDIETAMANWLTANGHSAESSTIREHARPIWKAINAD